MQNNLSAYAIPRLPSFPLPALPPIRSPTILTTVLTHASTHSFSRRAQSFDVDADAVVDYEKLEHVGDSLLGASAAVLLHDMYPVLAAGPSTMLKGQMVSNASLAQLSVRYGLPDRLLCERNSLWVTKGQVKVQASVLEAYVAGVYYDALDGAGADGDSGDSGAASGEGAAWSLVNTWLRALFEPVARHALKSLQAEVGRLTGLYGPWDADASFREARARRQEDERAVGALGALHIYAMAARLTLPTYRGEQVAGGPSPDHGGAWKVTCEMTDETGTVWTASAIRASQKAGRAVAAYKVCQRLKLPIAMAQVESAEADRGAPPVVGRAEPRTTQPEVSGQSVKRKVSFALPAKQATSAAVVADAVETAVKLAVDELGAASAPEQRDEKAGESETTGEQADAGEEQDSASAQSDVDAPEKQSAETIVVEHAGRESAVDDDIEKTA